MSRKPLEVGSFGSQSVSYRSTEECFVASTRYRGHDGETVRILARGPSEEIAVERLEEKKARVKTQDSSRNLTLLRATFEAIDYSELNRKEIRQQTADSYRGTVRRHLEKHWMGAMDPRDVTVPMAEQLIEDISAHAPSQARILRIVLKSTYDRLLRVGVVDRSADNPFTYTLPPVQPKRNPEIFPFEKIPELRAGIRRWAAVRGPGPARPTYLIDLVDILLLTGMRIGEVLALRWSDIELPAAMVDEVVPLASHAGVSHIDSGEGRAAITVNGTLLQKRFKGEIRQPITKSDTSWRRLVVSDTVTRILAERYRFVCAMFEGRSPWVFPNRTGREPILLPSMYRSWRSARAEAGFPHVTPHSCRRTLATFLDEALSDRGGLEVARRVLGHSSKEVTERHYRARTPTSVPDVSSVMEEILGASPSTGEATGNEALEGILQAGGADFQLTQGVDPTVLQAVILQLRDALAALPADEKAA